MSAEGVSEQVDPPAWRRRLDGWLADAGPSVDARLAQLATVHDGLPACRTVVVRDLVDVAALRVGREIVSAACVAFVADRRSAKVGDGSPRDAELCWYVAPRGEQFRLRGALVTIGPADGEPRVGTKPLLADVRRTLWANLSPATRAMFGWPAPGAPRADADHAQAAADNATGDDLETDDNASPPATFAALLLAVARVDWLRLARDGIHQREVEYLHPGGRWHRERVNP